MPPDALNLFESLGPDGQKSAISLLDAAAGANEPPGLAALVKAWLPELEGHRDIKVVKDDEGAFSYQRHTGDLFVDGVRASDVMQGSIGDCYLAAAIAAVAASRPKAIEEMFTPAGPGLWSVRFYRKEFGGAYKEERVVVDADLPTRGVLDPNRPWRTVGGPAYARGTTTNEKGRELWPSLLEKAYAKWKGSYDDIGHGGMPGAVMEAILGKEAESAWTSWSEDDKLWKAIVEAGTSGRPMSAYTDNDDKRYADKNDKVVGSHAYTVLGGVEKNGKRIVKMRNPWGSPGMVNFRGRMIYGAEFELPFEEFKRLFEGYDRV